IRMGARIFNREELLGRALDQFNLRWVFRTFWAQFRGPLEGPFSLPRWYRLSVFPALRRLRSSVSVTLVCVLAALIGGWLLGTVGEWSNLLDGINTDDATLRDNLESWFDLSSGNPHLILMAINQNSRVLMAATILAVFTFGVMAMVLVMVPFGIFGFVMAQFMGAGLNPLLALMAVLPHGTVEIPAILISGAAALRLGSIVTRPPEDMTVGEAWVHALADTIKIGIAVVFPMLVIAAVLEVTVTPWVVELVFSL
ncbi:MAG: stage II sporulation protein M, partial [Anaerolineae bacterium]|nr:stage II sporulation protein M [Anaerolineae bacterium]